MDKFFKKSVCFGIVLLFLFSIGCFEKDSEDSSQNVSFSVKEFSFNLDDLNKSGFEKKGEEHKKEPYEPDEGMVFEGWKILEKYKVRFQKNSSHFIIQLLGKIPSNKKQEQFTEKIRNADMGGFTFEEINMKPIGDESYLGVNNSAFIYGRNVTIYLMAFRIENVIVALFTADFPKKDIIKCAHIIEGNINDVIS